MWKEFKVRIRGPSGFFGRKKLEAENLAQEYRYYLETKLTSSSTCEQKMFYRRQRRCNLSSRPWGRDSPSWRRRRTGSRSTLARTPPPSSVYSRPFNKESKIGNFSKLEIFFINIVLNQHRYGTYRTVQYTGHPLISLRKLLDYTVPNQNMWLLQSHANLKG